MRILFLICALHVATVENAFAIKPASPEEIKDIQEQIFIGNRMDKEVSEAATALSDARDAKASDAEIKRRERILAREKDKQSAARTMAVHMTIRAYGLEPASWSGKSVMPSTKDRKITWMPVARDSEARQVQSADGALQDVKQDKKDYVGLTYPDGVTIMPPKAFEKGPGYLASILLHERIHFEQFTTAGKGNVMTYAEAQREAYKAQADNGLYFFDVKNDAERKMKEGIEGLLATEVIKVDDENRARMEARKGLKGLIRKFLPPAPPPDIFEAKVHTNAELADISGLVAQARGQAELARREHEERLKSTINNMATRSVKWPGSITQAELDKLPQRYAQDGFYITDPDFWQSVYLYLYNGGRDEEELRKLSTPPLKPVDALIPPPAQAVQPIQVTPIARQPAQPPFSEAFPLMREFALEACRAPEHVAIGGFLTRIYDFTHKSYDDELAGKFATGLSGCASTLFNQLVVTMRAGHAWGIDRQWIQSKVAETGGGSSGGRPQYGGPDQTHPIIVFPKPPW